MVTIVHDFKDKNIDYDLVEILCDQLHYLDDKIKEYNTPVYKSQFLQVEKRLLKVFKYSRSHITITKGTYENDK